MNSGRRQTAKLLVRILLTAGLLIWVFSLDDVRANFRETLKTARWQYLIAVWAVTFLLFLIRSVKMRLILKEQSCDVDVVTVFGATAVTCLYSVIMPGMLSTGVKWYILRKSTGKGSNVLSSMFYNQMSMMFVVTAFGLGALMIGNPTSLMTNDVENQRLLPMICGVLLTAVVVLALLLLSKRVGGMAIEAIKFLLRPLPQAARQKGRDVLDQIAVFQSSGWRFHSVIAFVTFVDSAAGGLVTYKLAAESANITVPLTVHLWLCAGVFILSKLPISVANLGVREVTLVGLLAIYGVDKPAALLMSMILFSALIFMAIIGAIFQLCWAPTANRAG